MDYNKHDHVRLDLPPSYDECCGHRLDEEISVTFDYKQQEECKKKVETRFLPDKCRYSQTSHDLATATNIKRVVKRDSIQFRIVIPLFIASVLLISCGPILMQKLLRGS